MAFSKRNSRAITVDQVRFRYCVSLGADDSDQNFPLNITVQAADGNGAKLRVIGLSTRDVWLDLPSEFPIPSSENWSEVYKVVRPVHVSKYITEAIQSGWRPSDSGPPFELRTSGSLPSDSN